MNKTNKTLMFQKQQWQMKQTLIEKEHLLLAPYQGKKGYYVIKSMKKRMKCLLPTGNVTKSAYADNKLSIPNVNIIIT